MSTKQAGKQRTYFQNLPKVDFKKLLKEAEERGYLICNPAKKKPKEEKEK